jgi:hypothetical protein
MSRYRAERASEARTAAYPAAVDPRSVAAASAAPAAIRATARTAALSGDRPNAVRSRVREASRVKRRMVMNMGTDRAAVAGREREGEKEGERGGMSGGAKRERRGRTWAGVCGVCARPPLSLF